MGSSFSSRMALFLSIVALLLSSTVTTLYVYDKLQPKQSNPFEQMFKRMIIQPQPQQQDEGA